jgi:hypothetical protein
MPLYDSQTGEVLRREASLGRLLVFGVVSLVSGGLFAAIHNELPFLAHWTGACSPDAYAYECEARPFWNAVAGVGVGLLMTAFSFTLHFKAPMRPTIRCRGCNTRGWVLDIEPTGGRCPRCGADRFDYRVVLARGGAGPLLRFVRENDVAGADLVQRFRETRTSALDRYL